MITFKKVRYSNVQASGNTPIEIDLNAYPKTLIVGMNGAGKTTFIDAICFCLYNKSLRGVTKPNFVNKINQKNLLAEVWFNNGKAEYLVRRGIKPNLFEIFKNEVLIDQNSENKDYQDILENNILKMNFKTFSQIDVLGSKDYVPFMKLAAAARREVVEDLLDIKIFSTMNTLLKERERNNRNDLSAISSRKDALEHSIVLVERMKTAVKVGTNEPLIAEKRQKLATIETNIQTARNLLSDNQEIAESYRKQVEDALSHFKAKTDIETVAAKLAKKKKTIQKIIDFYSAGECATCKQPIEKSFGQTKIEENRLGIEIITKQETQIEDALARKFNNAEEDLAAIKASLKTIVEEVSDAEERLRKLNQSKQWLEEQIEELLNPSIVEPPDEDVLRSTREELASVRIEQERLTKDRELISVMSNLLKDGGIKTNIVRQYIPIINSLINKYLDKFDFFLDFQFDENFNETINARYMDGYTYYSFSAGERQRIDMAILFAWRDLAKMRNSASSSILIMDEILDGSLDHEGTDDFMRLLTAVESSLNIFVISHKADAYIDRFDKIVTFVKKNKFSMIKAEE